MSTLVTGEPIRVLVVEASTGGVVGGSLTGLVHLIRGLDRRRFAPALVLYERKGIEGDLQGMDVPVYHIYRHRGPRADTMLNHEGYRRVREVFGVRSVLQSGRHLYRLFAEEFPAAFRLMRVIRASGADVVHLGNGARANFDGLLACWMTGTPSVCHVKGFEKFSNRERWTSGHIDALVCMTRAVEDYCKRHGVRGRRTQVIYDALDEEGFLPSGDPAEIRATLGVTEGAPCVGVVGNIQEWKGQIVFVEAMARVAAAVPGVRGLIIGGVHRAGAEYGERLQDRIRALSLDGVVSITGFRRDIADVMNTLDVVVHTSTRAEPFGRVILEGMFLGKPVVASAAGGVPELIEEGRTGFLLPPGQPAALADCLIRLLKEPELRRTIGEQARTRARDRFSLRRHVEEMSMLYETLTRRS